MFSFMIFSFDNMLLIVLKTRLVHSTHWKQSITFDAILVRHTAAILCR